jgi:hypothetical protein
MADAIFHKQLLAFDRDLAATARAKGCSCRGVLHSGDFNRKPRGAPRGLGDDHARRFSFNCSVRRCRKRNTPSSLRFLGRKVYVATVVILAAALQHGATEARLQHLAAVPGVDRRTLRRWREWWLKAFQESRFWQAAKAAFMPPADAASIPLSVLDRFAGAPEARLLTLLRFLLPITGGASARAV